MEEDITEGGKRDVEAFAHPEFYSSRIAVPG